MKSIYFTRPIKKIFLSFLVFVIAAIPAIAEISLIRDSEIEYVLKNYSKDIFKAAGLNPKAVNIYIVNDNRVNAFAAGGQNIFINTGLLIKSKSADEVIGVIAHETGHIAGGHLARTKDAIKSSVAQSIVTSLLGVAVGIATKNGEIGAGILTMGQSLAQYDFLHYSRQQESAADQAALSYLEKTKRSAKGLSDLFHTLKDQTLLPEKYQDPYVRTHPFPSKRIQSIQSHMHRSHYSDNVSTAKEEDQYLRVKAKLIGFLFPYKDLHSYYPKEDNSLYAQYAKAIALYRSAYLDKALNIIDNLIRSHPQDPFFIELKAQMLFENGHIEKAIKNYKQALNILPDDALMKMSLAHALIESNKTSRLSQAEKYLLQAQRYEKNNPRIWHLLAIIYGKQKDFGKSSLSLALKALHLGDKDQARQQANRALKYVKKNSKEWIKVQDILKSLKKQSN